MFEIWLFKYKFDNEELISRMTSGKISEFIKLYDESWFRNLKILFSYNSFDIKARPTFLSQSMILKGLVFWKIDIVLSWSYVIFEIIII